MVLQQEIKLTLLVIRFPLPFLILRERASKNLYAKNILRIESLETSPKRNDGCDGRP